MARDGYISTYSAIRQLTKIVGDGSLATRLVGDALASGAFGSRGKKQLHDPPRSEVLDAEHLRSISDFEAPALGKPEIVRESFWPNATEKDRSQWDLRRGTVLASVANEIVIYERLQISEESLNSFLAVHRARLNIEQPKQIRTRRADWGDWVSALAFLVAEGAVRAGMKSSAVRSLVDDRLDDWGLESMADSTVGPVVARLLEHLDERRKT